MVTVLPDVVSLTVNSIGRAALDATLQPGVLQSWIDELDNYVETNGKFSKTAIAYIPFSPPPLFWDYKCRKCLKFEEPDGCAWVDGTISPRGWCAIWVPPDTYKPFTWPSELIKGDW